MSQLKPGTTYVYERVDGMIYAREMGSTERILIGEEYPMGTNSRKLVLTDKWIPIIEAAETNPALQDALNRAILVYELSKQHNPILHHPV